jgi:TonB family protein
VGRLYVLTYPPGAAVWVDGDSVGVTPVPPHALREGTHALSIRKEGFAPYDTVVWLASDETSFHHVELVAGGARSMRPAQASPARAQSEGGTEEASGRGGIAVSSDPAGSEVWIDDERVGTTPLTLSGLTRGWHRLSIRHDGYEPQVVEVEVEPGAVADLQVTLVEPEGALTVLVRPWGSIYIDGRLHKLDTDAPYRTALAVGTYRVKALHPTLGALEREVVVEAGGAERIVLDLSSDGEGAARPVVVPRDRAGSSPPDRAPSPPEVFDIAEVPPVLLGGLEELHRRARYPERAYAFGVEGQVFLQFVVGEDGRVREPRVVRGLGMGCDEEALRVIREARFTPGSVGGKPVAVRHAVSIRFKRDEP